MDLDGFLKQKLKQELNEENIEINVEELIHNVEHKKRKNKIKIVSIAACLIIFAIFLVPIVLNITPKELQNVADIKTEKAEDKSIIEIEYEDDGTMLKVGQIDYKYFMNRSLSSADYSVIVNIVIAKVSNIEYYNYADNLIKYGNNRETITYSGYCLPRTRVDLDIRKQILGNFKEGDKLKAYTNGGIVTYDEYIKYMEDNLLFADLEKVNLEYNALKEEGKNNIYVSCFRKGDTHLEKDKTYLMVIRKKMGEEYIEPSSYLLRECNLEDNTVLNYQTGEWEKIQDVLGGIDYE